MTVCCTSKLGVRQQDASAEHRVGAMSGQRLLPEATNRHCRTIGDIHDPELAVRKRPVGTRGRLCITRDESAEQLATAGSGKLSVFEVRQCS